MSPHEDIIDAASLGDMAKLRAFVAAGGDLNQVRDDDGEDVLTWYLHGNCEGEHLRELIAMGCHPTNGPCVGMRALVPAIWNKEPWQLEVLLAAGADPNAISFKDETYPVTALDTVLGDYCVCDTPEDVAAMERNEALIRAAGGKCLWELKNSPNNL